MITIDDVEIEHMTIAELKQTLKLCLQQYKFYKSKIVKMSYTKFNLKRKIDQTNARAKSKEADKEKKNLDILDVIKAGKVFGQFKNAYHEKVKDFSMQMNAVSPVGYRMLKILLQPYLMPAKRTLTHWIKDINGSEGITGQSMGILSKLSSHHQISHNGIKLRGCLKADEIHIRKGIQYVPHQQKFYGLADVGCSTGGFDNNDEEVIDESENPQLASKSLFFLFRGLNTDIGIPVGYLNVSSLNAAQRQAIFNQLILEHEKNGVVIESVTVDGDPTNIAMAELNGAKIKMKTLNDKIDVHMRIPGIDHPVCFTIDIVHDLKNARNAFADKIMRLILALKDIFTVDQLKYLLGKYYSDELLEEDAKLKHRYVKWEYLEKLHEIQSSAGLSAANKFRKIHLNFRKNKMNVGLAAVTVGDKTSNSILYFDQEKHLKEFDGSLATVIFMKIINLSFDLGDTKNMNCYGQKKPFCLENAEERFKFMANIEKFFKCLEIQEGSQLKWKPLLLSNRHTAFTGIITTFETTKSLYESLVLTGILDHLATRKLTQDELERFFGYIRCHLGNNNNPSAYQLACVFRKILALKKLYFVREGNCNLEENEMQQFQQDLNGIYPNIKIQFPKSTKKNTRKATSSIAKSVIEKRKAISNESIEIVRNESQIYISGFVQKRIIEKSTCARCVAILSCPENAMQSEFIEFKSNGQLIFPHKEVYEICRMCDNFFNIQSSQHLSGNLHQKVALKVLENLSPEVLDEINDHAHDYVDFQDMRYIVIKKICDIFLKSKSKKFATDYTLEQHKEYLRQQSVKLVQFHGQ